MAGSPLTPGARRVLRGLGCRGPSAGQQSPPAWPTAGRCGHGDVQAQRRARHRVSGHNPGQSGRHIGENGRSSPTASMTDCSRSMVSSTTWPTSSSSVVASVALGGYGEQLGQGNLHAPLHRAEASGALADGGRSDRPGHQHAFGYRLHSQIELQRSTPLDRDQIQSDARRAGHGVTDGEHPSRTSTQPRDVDHHRRGRVSLRCGTVVPRHRRNPNARVA